MAESPKTVLVVDPDSDFLHWAKKQLETPSTSILCESDSKKALDIYISESPDLLLAELHVAPLNGMDLLRQVRLNDPNSMVVLTSSFPPTSAIIEAMKLGAYDFLRKESLPYDLRHVVEEALSARETIQSTDPGPQDMAEREEIISAAPAMVDVFKIVGRVSRSDAPVLITGESGSGKEVVANAIHRHSRRGSRDFIAINCAAIPENLLESELFGHEKGSFTGAATRRVGRFEQGDGGTLFLDEIGDMPLPVQSKILRVLQEGEFSRLGGNETLRTDVRILAATNKNLEAEVASGAFREDLFYRLNVVRIHIPPLRQRREDIRPLSEFFLERIAREKSSPHLRLSGDAIVRLESHAWPGNVRELENTLHRASVLATSDVLIAKDIPLGTAIGSSGITHQLHYALEVLLGAADAADKPPLDYIKSAALQHVLKITGDDPKKAATLLKLTPAALRKLLADT